VDVTAGSTLGLYQNLRLQTFVPAIVRPLNPQGLILPLKLNPSLYETCESYMHDACKTCESNIACKTQKITIKEALHAEKIFSARLKIVFKFSNLIYTPVIYPRSFTSLWVRKLGRNVGTISPCKLDFIDPSALSGSETRLT
jgi:hypothetical protein